MSDLQPLIFFEFKNGYLLISNQIKYYQWKFLFSQFVSYRMNEQEKKYTLKVSHGTEQLPQVDDKALSRYKKSARKKYTVKEYTQGILNRDITILSQTITLIESSLPEHRKESQQIIEKCMPFAGNSLRIGITGVPGVGKSTFIEAFGTFLAKKGKRLSVLAIDPSSEISKGSILGDKTRMENLSANNNVYIRPSPSAGSLGGVSRKTRETIILCEAAGFDIIIVETVGVGQSETAVHSMVDFFLLLMLAGAGDELQGIKRGIIEMANMMVINKADGDNKIKAEHARAEYQSALHLFPPADSGWAPKVLTCSAKFGSGVSEIWEEILNYIDHTKNNGTFNTMRQKQSKYWMYETINESLQQNFYQNNLIKDKIIELEYKVCSGSISSFSAANLLLKEYFKGQHHAR